MTIRDIDAEALLNDRIKHVDSVDDVKFILTALMIFMVMTLVMATLFYVASDYDLGAWIVMSFVTFIYVPVAIIPCGPILGRGVKREIQRRRVMRELRAMQEPGAISLTIEVHQGGLEMTCEQGAIEEVKIED